MGFSGPKLVLVVCLGCAIQFLMFRPDDLWSDRRIFGTLGQAKKGAAMGSKRSTAIAASLPCGRCHPDILAKIYEVFYRLSDEYCDFLLSLI